MYKGLIHILAIYFGSGPEQAEKFRNLYEIPYIAVHPLSLQWERQVGSCSSLQCVHPNCYLYLPILHVSLALSEAAIIYIIIHSEHNRTSIFTSAAHSDQASIFSIVVLRFFKKKFSRAWVSPILYFWEMSVLNPESCRSKQALYQLSHPSPY